MNLFIWKDNQQQGPFTEEEIREHLAAGIFLREDMAWTEGQGDWKPLAEVLGRGETPPPPPEQMQAGKAATNYPRTHAMVSSAKGFAEDMAAKTTVAGHLAQKQALRKKLELVDLKQSDYLLGVKAYESGVTLPEDSESNARLDKLKSEIAVLQQAELPHDSFTDKVKAAAGSAWDKARMEKLKMEQRFALIELGSKWRAGSHPIPPELITEMNAAQAVEETIKALEMEIEQMSRGTYRWAKQPLIVLLLIVLAGAGVVIGMKALRRNDTLTTTAMAPRVVNFKGYNKAGWLEGFYKGDIGPLNANRQEILFYCNFFDQAIAELLPLLHDAEIPQAIVSQTLHRTLSDPMAGFRALIGFVKQAQAPGGPEQMMNDVASQETLKEQAVQDAERLVTSEDPETVKCVYNGLRTFVRNDGGDAK